jgi:hypothetical protein
MPADVAKCRLGFYEKEDGMYSRFEVEVGRLDRLAVANPPNYYRSWRDIPDNGTCDEGTHLCSEIATPRGIMKESCTGSLRTRVGRARRR